MKKQREDKPPSEKSHRTMVLVFRCALFPLAALTGFSFGGGCWLWGAQFFFAWLILCLLALYFFNEREFHLSKAIIGDAFFKSLIIGALLFTVLGFDGFHTRQYLALSILVAPALLISTHHIFKRGGKLEGLPTKFDYVILTTCVVWAVEAVFYVRSLSPPAAYDWSDLNKHGLSLTAATVVWTVVMAVAEAYSRNRTGEDLYQKVRNMAQEHVTSTTLDILRETLPNDLEDDRIAVIKCYHSTSLLFGFWLNPLIEEEKDANILSYALRHAQLQVPITVRLVGPSPIGLEYLLLSRLHALMYVATRRDNEFRQKKWRPFLSNVIADVGAGNRTAKQLLVTDTLSDSRSANWWRMLDALRWYLLYVYYRRLKKCYCDQPLSNKCHVRIAECVRYDHLIREALASTEGYENGSLLTQDKSTDIWHIETIRQLYDDTEPLLKAIRSLDQVFFPEYAFAILSPRDEDMDAGMRSKYLLCHNVLNTLAFSCLHPQPPSILRLMHDDLVRHYERAFNSEWGDDDVSDLTNDPNRVRPAYLDPTACSTRWERLMEFAWDRLNQVIGQTQDKHSQKSGE